MVDLRLFVFPWLCTPKILPFLVCTKAFCAPHDFVSPMMSHAGVVECERFPLGVPSDAGVIAAFTRQWRRSVSSSSRSSRSSPERNLRELVRSQRRLLLSEHRRPRRCNGSCRGKRGLCWPGDDGRREQRALAILSAEPHVSSAGRTMTGLACSFPSSSDAPVCVAGTGCLRKVQSSHARPDDRAMTTFFEKRVKITRAAAIGPVLAVPVNGNRTGAMPQLAVVALRIPVSRLTHGVCSHAVVQ